jgi:hypothetical protein
MNAGKKALIAILSVVVIVIGLRVCVSFTPVQVGNGPVWDSVEDCAEIQQRLYQYLESFVEENGRIPSHLDEFTIKGFPATYVWKCPASQGGYDVFLENYGNPKAVLIADQENKHPTTFMLWFRGFKPQVQTMGDGTIHLFKGGKLMTMHGSMNN